MKRVLFLIAILATLLPGCDQLNSGGSVGEVEELFKESELAKLDGVSAEPSSATLKFTPGIAWKAYTDREWLSVSPSSGGGEEITIKISIAENLDTEERNGMVVVELNSGNRYEIPVRQLGAEGEGSENNPTLDLIDGGHDYTIAAEGGSVDIEIRTNTNYEVSIPTEAQSWLTLSDTRTMRDETLTFTATKNNTGVARRAEVLLLYNQGEKVTLPIWQDSYNEPFLTLVEGENCSVNAEGGYVEVKISTNTEFKVNIPVEATWLKQVITRTSRDEILTFEASKNDTGVTRRVVVELEYGTDNTVLFTIAQEAIKQGGDDGGNDDGGSDNNTTEDFTPEEEQSPGWS